MEFDEVFKIEVHRKNPQKMHNEGLNIKSNWRVKE